MVISDGTGADNAGGKTIVPNSSSFQLGQVLREKPGELNLVIDSISDKMIDEVSEYGQKFIGDGATDDGDKLVLLLTKTNKSKVSLEDILTKYYIDVVTSSSNGLTNKQEQLYIKLLMSKGQNELPSPIGWKSFEVAPDYIFTKSSFEYVKNNHKVFSSLINKKVPLNPRWQKLVEEYIQTKDYRKQIIADFSSSIIKVKKTAELSIKNLLKQNSSISFDFAELFFRSRIKTGNTYNKRMDNISAKEIKLFAPLLNIESAKTLLKDIIRYGNGHLLSNLLDLFNKKSFGHIKEVINIDFLASYIMDSLDSGLEEEALQALYVIQSSFNKNLRNSIDIILTHKYFLSHQFEELVKEIVKDVNSKNINDIVWFIEHPSFPSSAYDKVYDIYFKESIDHFNLAESYSKVDQLNRISQNSTKSNFSKVLIEKLNENDNINQIIDHIIKGDAELGMKWFKVLAEQNILTQKDSDRIIGLYFKLALEKSDKVRLKIMNDSFNLLYYKGEMMSNTISVCRCGPSLGHT